MVPACDLRGGLLARIIPPERVVIAMRVCSAWRTEIPQHASKVTLAALSQGSVLFAPTKVMPTLSIIALIDVCKEDIVRDIRRFEHYGVNIVLRTHRNPEISRLVLEALGDVEGVGRVIDVDLRDVNLTSLRTDALSRSIGARGCSDISSIWLQSSGLTSAQVDVFALALRVSSTLSPCRFAVR